MGLGGRRIMNIYGDLDRAGVSLFYPSDNDFIAVADDFNVARAGEENHGAGMLVDRSFMGNLFDIKIEDRIPREVLVCMRSPSKKNSIQLRFSETPRIRPAAFLIRSISSSPTLSLMRPPR